MGADAADGQAEHRPDDGDHDAQEIGRLAGQGLAG
jgi:hypothetical protein